MKKLLILMLLLLSGCTSNEVVYDCPVALVQTKSDSNVSVTIRREEDWLIDNQLSFDLEINYIGLEDEFEIEHIRDFVFVTMYDEEQRIDLNILETLGVKTTLTKGESFVRSFSIDLLEYDLKLESLELSLTLNSSEFKFYYTCW